MKWKFWKRTPREYTPSELAARDEAKRYGKLGDVAGQFFARAFLWEAFKLIVIVMLVSGAINAILPLIYDRADSSDMVWTDNKGHKHVAHSGMKIRTDWGTGCQYLVGPNGDLSPRRIRLKDGEVTQICIDIYDMKAFDLLNDLTRTRGIWTWAGKDTDDSPDKQGGGLAVKNRTLQRGAQPAS